MTELQRIGALPQTCPVCKKTYDTMSRDYDMVFPMNPQGTTEIHITCDKVECHHVFEFIQEAAEYQEESYRDHNIGSSAVLNKDGFWSVSLVAITGLHSNGVTSRLVPIPKNEENRFCTAKEALAYGIVLGKAAIDRCLDELNRSRK